MKESFVFYRSFYEALRKLEDKNLKADIYDAICELALNDNEIVLDETIGKIILDLIYPQIKANNKRYENGIKGGCPKGIKKPSMIGNQNAKKDKTKPKQNQNKTKTKPNVNDNVNDNDNDNVVVDIYTYVENLFSRTLNPTEYEEISKWNDNSLTRYAIKEAVLNNACNIKYINSILNRYRQENIKTIEEAEESERLHSRYKPSIKKNNEEKMREYFERRKNEGTTI